MAIALYVSDGYGGYGDLLFGLKVLNGLKKNLTKIGYDEPLYLITQESGKKKILQLEGDREFGVEVKSIEEFNISKGAQSLDYFIEGPVFNPYTHNQIAIPDDTPVLLVSEYSDIYQGRYLAKERLTNWLRWELNVIQSGFCTQDNTSSELGQGLLFSEELLQVAENKRNNCFTFRDKYWSELQNFSEKILKNQSIESYHQTTDLFFEYSHDTGQSSNVYHSNQCERYLQIHQLFNETSSKNQDIISVGKNIEVKRNALINLLPTLKASGYNKIVYIDLESGTEEILHDEQQYPEKVYRFYYAKQLTHREIIAIQALSGDLVGTTGDQSFGEALSCEKLIVYECLSHKITLANEFIQTFRALDSGGKASQLASLLIEGKIDPEMGDSAQRNQLKDLLRDPKVIRQYHDICQKIHKKYDLIESVVSTIEPILNPNSNDISRRLRKYVYASDINKFKKLIEENKVDFLIPNQQGTSLLKYIFSKKKFDFIEAKLSLQLSKEEDLLPHVTYINLLRGRISVNSYHKFPILSNTLFIDSARKSYKFILKYQPAKKSNKLLKREAQKKFLSDVFNTTNYNEYESSKQVLIAALLLVRKSIRNESYFYHGSKLLASIEKELRKLNINPQDKKLIAVSYNALKKHTEKNPAFLKKIVYLQDFHKFSNIKLDLSSMKEKTPIELKPHRIKLYQEAIRRLGKSKKDILKISRKDPILSSLGLPFSIIRYPNDQGFYLLAHGEGSLLGQGGWGKVKLAYYCNQDGIINPNPLAIKIERTKNSFSALNELGMFKLAHPREETHIYKQGLRLANKKSYSAFPKFPGVPLDNYLSENQNLTDQERLYIASLVMQSLADLHSKGIAHLDLKPKNIIYNPNEGKAYLVDFGCAEKFNVKIKFNNLNDAKFAIENMPPEYFSNNCLVNQSLDIYSCVGLLGQIIGVSLVDLVRGKLTEALNVFQSTEIKKAILEKFNETNSLDITLFSLPSFVYRDPNFNTFLKEFCRSEKFNFTYEDEKLNKILARMADKDPKNRPEANEVKIYLDQITASNEVSAQNTLKK